MNNQFKTATTSGRGNLISRDDLFLSDDPSDREAYFHGEEGFDFQSEEPSLPDMAISINVRLQQQPGKTREQLEQQFIQQQQMRPQM